VEASTVEIIQVPCAFEVISNKKLIENLQLAWHTWSKAGRGIA
jgi:hypothetical protein